MWESHEGKQLENKWVFRRLQETGKVCADVMSGGRLFQSRLPATAKARSAAYDFLLTFQSNHGPISYRFRDKRRF